MRISSTARYVAAFQQGRRFQPDADTLGLWHFDRLVGLYVPDASTQGRTMVLVGAEIAPGSAGAGCVP